MLSSIKIKIIKSFSVLLLSAYQLTNFNQSKFESIGLCLDNCIPRILADWQCPYKCNPHNRRAHIALKIGPFQIYFLHTMDRSIRIHLLYAYIERLIDRVHRDRGRIEVKKQTWFQCNVSSFVVHLSNIFECIDF